MACPPTPDTAGFWHLRQVTPTEQTPVEGPAVSQLPQVRGWADTRAGWAGAQARSTERGGEHPGALGSHFPPGLCRKG